MNTQDFISPKYTIFTGYAGSKSYGTAIPSSDTDIRGLFCPDPINIRTPFFKCNEVEDNSEEDTKYYELSHFMKLCLDCNPNIIEMLWIDESDILTTSDAYKTLRDNRASLLSSKIAFTTSGYAMAQLKRIKGHNKWINNPQKVSAPEPIDFLSLVQWYGNDTKIMPKDFNARDYKKETRLVPYGGDIFGMYVLEHSDHMNTTWSELYDDAGKLNTVFTGDRHLLPQPTAIVKFNKEEYKLAKRQHELYWTWKHNRNEKRSALEEKHGYDSKHALHLVRLMRMGKEALEDGHILVRRPDAAELLDIRNGKWTYEELLEYATDMDNEIQNKLYKTTSLPKKPDLLAAAKLLMEVQDSIWSERAQ